MITKEVTRFESLYPDTSRLIELDKVIAYIKHGQSVQAIGLPGVGQSTFLKLLSYNKKIRLKHLGNDCEKYHFVLINFSQVRSKSLYEVNKLIFLSLLDSLRERRMEREYEKLNMFLKETMVINDELVLFQGLKQGLDFLTLDQNLSVVFLFDRFEEYVPMVTSDLFTNLSIIRSRAKYKFSVVISLSRPLDELLELSQINDFKEYISENKVYLSLNDDSILNFRINQLEELYKKTLDISLKNEILSLTCGLGRLTKNCVQFVISDKAAEGLNNNKLDDLFLTRPSIQTPLMDIWQTLTPSEQDFLLSYTDYSSSDTDYPYLLSVGLLKDGKMTIPLFEIYLRNAIKNIEKKTENEPIQYNAEKDEISQGEDKISDRLTRSEFKLLRFLIEKQNSVVNREAIISAVWTDAATTIGVTDQALDQLLLRLRRKIEDDPNSPIHIQTVKGRGVRFAP